MDGIDGLGQNLYFNAQNTLASQNAANAKKQEKSSAVRKSRFASALEKSQAEYDLKLEGFPVEIAGMEIEEAVIYLKDAADIAADELKKHQLPENFADYRQKLSQLMRYIVKHNYTVEKYSRYGRLRENKKKSKQTQVVVINEKLDNLARVLIYGNDSPHRETISMLTRIEEISGLIIDLMAT